MSLANNNPVPQGTPRIPIRPVPTPLPASPEKADDKPADKTTKPAAEQASGKAVDKSAKSKPDTKPESQAAAPSTPTDTESKTARKSERGGLLLDTLLVLLLAGALGGGIWYLQRELSQYRIPGPMEQAAAANVELCRQREALQPAAYHADEQLHLRRRLAALVQKNEELKRRIDEKKQAIETQHQKVLAVQHEIRQEDKTARSVARGLLPGMSIGDATTTTGRVYNNAVIYRLESGRITLRTPEGQVRFPTNILVKDTLPDLARYAFGLDDMVDMSDFEVTSDQPAPKPRKGKLIPAKTAPKADNTPTDYEPTAGAPVLDTNGNATTTLTAPPTDDPTSEAPVQSWQPPTGELPL
ncbi:MAG: hypothetical protein ACI4OS_02625 [Akkermansia sp.]